MVVHSHLCLDLSCSLQHNADGDQDGGTAECQTTDTCVIRIYDHTRYHVHDQGEHSNDTEEQCTDQCDSAKHAGNVIRSCLTGAEALDRTTVLLQIVCHLCRIEADCDIEAELPFVKAGLNVIVTKDALEMYRTRKVRILNGAHTSLVAYALLEGFDTVKKVYKAAGVPENCAMTTGEGGHRYYKANAWEAFDKIVDWDK